MSDRFEWRENGQIWDTGNGCVIGRFCSDGKLELDSLGRQVLLTALNDWAGGAAAAFHKHATEHRLPKFRLLTNEHRSVLLAAEAYLLAIHKRRDADGDGAASAEAEVQARHSQLVGVIEEWWLLT